MMGIRRYRLLGALLLVAAATSPAHAATDSPMIVADAGKAVPSRFISLEPVRSGMAGVRVVSPEMRSDRAAMNSGFMRMDRSRIGTVRRQAATPEVTATAPVAIIAPSSDKDVLDLFGDATPEKTPATRLGRVAHAWPLPKNETQRLTSAFGKRRDPFSGRRSFHSGIDIAAAKGTSVLASADGTVTGVSAAGRIGKYVSVEHGDGSESSYGHMSTQSVRMGQKVRQGQKLGEVGSTGRSTGAHLHYALKRQGEQVNPMTVMRQPAGTPTSVASHGMNGRGGSSPMIITVR